jgi:hypothetical protein
MQEARDGETVDYPIIFLQGVQRDENNKIVRFEKEWDPKMSTLRTKEY